MSGFFPGSLVWAPEVGDYGCEALWQIGLALEADNCELGCVRAGSTADLLEFGPSGKCQILLGLCQGKVVAEVDPRPQGPHCRMREPITGGLFSVEEATG